MESLDLTTPEITPPKATDNYKVIYLEMHWEQDLINIKLRGENSEIKEFKYGGSGPMVSDADRQKAHNMMVTLNKANLSVKSLHRRILDQLIADGFISGTVSGTPD